MRTCNVFWRAGNFDGTQGAAGFRLAALFMPSKFFPFVIHQKQSLSDQLP